MVLAQIKTKLQERGLLKGVTGELPDREIAWMTCDSRNAVRDTLFICKGAAFLPEYLEEAAEKGEHGLYQ